MKVKMDMETRYLPATPPRCFLYSQSSQEIDTMTPIYTATANSTTIIYQTKTIKPYIYSYQIIYHTKMQPT